MCEASLNDTTNTRLDKYNLESFNVYETELTTGHYDGDQLFYTLQILLLQQKNRLGNNYSV